MAFPAKEGIKILSLNPVTWDAGLVSSFLLSSLNLYKVQLKNLELLTGTEVGLILGSVRPYCANQIHAS